MAGRRLLILGGGFGGLDVARAVGRSRAARGYWDTLLVDKENFFQFNPLLPAVAVGAVETRHIVWPLREIIGALQRDESGLVTPATHPFLRDLYDHTIQIIDTVETFRDLITGMLDLYLSAASTRMNEIMKVLTIISTLFIPLTFLVGVYGMNFDNLPELHWRWGYFLLWGVMLSTVGGMFVFFRRKGWL